MLIICRNTPRIDNTSHLVAPPAPSLTPLYPAYQHNSSFIVCCLQTSAVQTQTTRVQKLRAQAATGKVSVARLEQEQGVLTKMTVRLAKDAPAASLDHLCDSTAIRIVMGTLSKTAKKCVVMLALCGCTMHLDMSTVSAV